MYYPLQKQAERRENTTEYHSLYRGKVISKSSFVLVTAGWANLILALIYYLTDVKKIEFPFAEFPDSYFLLQLKDKEVLVNQFNGTIVSEVNYPFTAVISYYSLIFHTGQASIIWSIVLLLACIAILFFIQLLWLQNRRDSLPVTTVGF